MAGNNTTTKGRYYICLPFSTNNRSDSANSNAKEAQEDMDVLVSVPRGTTVSIQAVGRIPEGSRGQDTIVTTSKEPKDKSS